MCVLIFIFFSEFFLLKFFCWKFCQKLKFSLFQKILSFVLPPGTHHHLFFLHNLVDQIYILKIPLYVVVQHHTIKSGVQVFVKRKCSSLSHSSTTSKRLNPPFILILFVSFLPLIVWSLPFSKYTEWKYFDLVLVVRTTDGCMVRLYPSITWSMHQWSALNKSLHKC